MRKQRAGTVVSISSTAGIAGQEFCSAYAASKFGVEGWMESLRFRGRAVRHPHHDRRTRASSAPSCSPTESTAYAELSIDDYAERTAQTRPAWESMSGKQTNDPAKLANALLTIVDQEQPPLRWVAGADAVETVEQKAKELLAAGRRLPRAVLVARSRRARAGAERELNTMSADQNTRRVAVITGASSGIGEATARALHADGHRVALLARRGDRIHALADELGNGAIAIEADVTDRDSLIAAAERVRSGTGPCRHPRQQRRRHAARTLRPPNGAKNTGAWSRPT